jgi:predicted phage terminase large subunit-like protein
MLNEAVVRRDHLLRIARKDFDTFFRLFSPRPSYLFGRHTLGMLAELNTVVADVRRGVSRYVILNVPFRHGKSDIASRRLPAWILMGQRPDDPPLEVILATYNFELSAGLSFDARECVRERGPEFGIGIAQDRDRIGSWYTTHGDALHAAGLGGTIIGRGADFLIIDDFHKNIQEAESQLIRDRVRESFKVDLMTRRAPVHAVIIVAQRWHPDDLCGWIESVNDPESELFDPDFPKFDVIKFPAQNDAWKRKGNPDGFLFPERFPASWYRSARALMSSGAWAALGLQDPRPRTGNFFRADKIQIVPPDRFDELATNAGADFVRGWDPASTAKELDSDDPDFSVGALAAYAEGKVFVRDVVRGQWGASRRDDVMTATAISDGSDSRLRIEAVAGYKDTFDRMATKLSGFCVVERVTPDKDKVARGSVLQAPIEAGNMILKRADWNEDFIKEFATFPKKGRGMKLDQVDATVIAVYTEITEAAARFGISRL